MTKRFTDVWCSETGHIGFTDNGVDKELPGSEFEDWLNNFSDEYEWLKSQLRIYRRIATCSNCDYHDYDWYDDGDEFEVCRKGNDVTERICADWRKL